MAPKPGRQETRQGRTKSMIKMLRPVAALGALTLAVLLSVAPVAAQQSNPDQAASPPAAGSPPPPLAGGPQGPRDFGRGPVPRGQQGMMGPGGPVPGQEAGRGPQSQMGPGEPEFSPPMMMGHSDFMRMCGPQASRFIEWHLENIELAVRPTDAQRVSFNNLKAAVKKAEDTVRASCPSELPLTPPGRLEVMEKRLAALLEAVKIVRPALDTLYKSLDDEQKARFIVVGPKPGHHWGWHER